MFSQKTGQSHKIRIGFIFGYEPPTGVIRTNDNGLKLAWSGKMQKQCQLCEARIPSWIGAVSRKGM